MNSLKRNISLIAIAALVLMAGSGIALAQVVNPPTITKMFTPATIQVNGLSTLSFTIGNTNTFNLTGVGFTPALTGDTLPAGVVVAMPNGLTGTCNGTPATATAGAGNITLTGATLPPGTCTFSVNVIGTTPGSKVNTVSVTSDQAAGVTPGTDTLTVVAPPTIMKAFGAASIGIGGTTTLTFTLTNPAANPVPLTAIAFTDTLPGGLTVAAANGLPNGTCGGAITAAANLISVSGVTLAAGAMCTFSVNVTGVSPGAPINTTSTISATGNGIMVTGLTATAAITVAPVIVTQGLYQLRYFANLPIADSYINATNAGTFDGFDPNGRICANFYVFDPREELVSCCSCLITPNGLVSLSARNDLINNTLTGAPLTAGITVKVLASLPTPVGGTVCSPSSPTAANLVRGLKLWAITPHGNTGLVPPPPASSAFTLTETEFASSELSLNELSKLTGFCRFIQVVASNFGVCRSCPTVGAQGAEVK